MAEDIGVAQEFVTTVIDLSAATSQTIYSGPCAVRGSYVNTVMNAFAANLTNTAGATKFTVPASAPAGAPFYHFDSTQDGLIVTSNASSTGSLAVTWKAFSTPFAPTV